MTALVTAASKHGATLEIAETIAHVLEDYGIPADLVEIDNVRDVGGYDANVIGSGIYLGNWLKKARRFLEAESVCQSWANRRARLVFMCSARSAGSGSSGEREGGVSGTRQAGLSRSSTPVMVEGS